VKTFKRVAPVIPGTTDTLAVLTAPAIAGRVFLLANGGYGFECSCGYVLTARIARLASGGHDADRERAAICCCSNAADGSRPFRMFGSFFPGFRGAGTYGL
jgi:hypothetical protein